MIYYKLYAKYYWYTEQCGDRMTFWKGWCYALDPDVQLTSAEAVKYCFQTYNGSYNIF